MKTLSTSATTVTLRPWARPVLLAQIDFTVPSAFTLRVSDDYRVALGQQWLPLVADWGTVEEALNMVDLGGQPATAELGLINSVVIEGAGKSRLSELIRTPLNLTGTYEWAFAKVTITQLLDPSHTSGDEVRLGVFYLEDPTEIDERILRVRMSDLSLVLEDKMQLTRVTKQAFPNADPDAVGRAIPVPFGRLTKIPVLAVVAGGQSTLTAAITAAAPGAGIALGVTDTSAFPESGLVQVDEEQMTYSGKTPTSLVLTARGAAGTTPMDHAAGAQIWEVRGGPKAYRYLVGESRGGFRIKSVSNIQANGVLQDSPTVDLADSTLVAGRSFAVINFPALPVLKRQVKLATIDAIAVTDNLDLGADTTTKTETPGTPGTPGTTISTPVTQTLQATVPVSTSVPLTRSSFPTGNSGVIPIAVPAPNIPVDNVNRTMTYRITEFSIASTQWSILGGDGRIIEQGTSPPALGSRTVQWGSGANAKGETLVIGVTGFGGGRFTVIVDSYQLNVNGSIQTVVGGTPGTPGTITTVTTTTHKSGGAFRLGQVTLGGNSTADVVIGDVTCDIEGLRDDSAGTVSGTPGLLLENPHDVVKAILLACFPGITTADLGPSWATTRSRLETFRYRWAGLLEYATFSALRKRLSDQARSVLYLEGGMVEFKFIEDAPTPGLTLDYLKDIWTETPAKISRTPRTELKTSLWAYSQRDYTKTGALEDRYARVKNVKDLKGTITDEIQDTLELDLIQNTSTADAIAGFHLTQKKRQRLVVDLVAWWTTIALDQVDYVAINNHPILAAYGGGTLVFQVIAKRYQLGDDHPGRIRLTLLETAGATSAVALGLPNIVITSDEIALGAPGAKTHLLFFATPTPARLADQNGLWFDMQPGRWFDTAGMAGEWFRTVAVTQRIYESTPIDKGKTGATPVTITTTTRIRELVRWFNEQPGEWFSNHPTDWFDAVQDTGATITVEVNRSDDNVTYNGWEAYVAGASLAFRYLKIRVRLTPSSDTAAVEIRALLATLDVPDFIVQLSEFAIGAAGTHLVFADQGVMFVVVPEILVTPLGAAAGLQGFAKNITLTDCLLELRDEIGQLTAGLADLVLAGY